MDHRDKYADRLGVVVGENSSCTDPKIHLCQIKLHISCAKGIAVEKMYFHSIEPKRKIKVDKSEVQDHPL